MVPPGGVSLLKVLVLAPHPYYVVRGTPIDLDLVLRVLSERPDCEIDVVVYAEGEDRHFPGVTFHRTPALPGLTGSGPGFSLRKLISDLFLAFKAWRLLARRRHDVIHAGEEAVFVAMVLGWLYRVPYAYDLDSSISQQMVEQLPWLRPVARLFDALETMAIRRAVMTLPVCNALADLCRARGASRVVTLHDISQLDEPGRAASGWLRRELGIDRLILLYAGNLAPYQGIDLLLAAFARAVRETDAIDLVVIGGGGRDVAAYRALAGRLGIGDRVHFLGPRPLEELGEYLAEADVLTVPRIRGLNTPMKVFPYLHSGRPVLVTDLPTHTQVLDSTVAYLAPPEPEAFGRAIVELAKDPQLRARLGAAGHAFVEAGHTFEAHRRRLGGAYDEIAELLARPKALAMVLATAAGLQGCEPQPATNRMAESGPAETAARVPTLDDMRGFTVRGILEDTVTLHDGAYEGEPRDSTAASARLVLLESSIRLGDLTDDDVDDAAALILAARGEEGVHSHLVVVRVQGERVENIGTAEIGERVVVRSMEIQNGRIVMEVVARGPGEADCCPTRKGVRSYWIDGDSLAASTEVADSVSAEDLNATAWRLAAIDTGVVPDDVVITASFDHGSVSGSTGCNDYSAAVDTTAGLDLTFASPTSTLRACPDPAGAWERRYLEGIRGTVRFTWLLQDLVLTFRREDGSYGVLRFEPA